MRGENEFFTGLNRFLPERLRIRRNLGQARDAGADGSLAFMEIEVKRQEKLRLKPWLEQVKVAAAEKVPVLAYRQNHGSWECLVVMDQLELASFICWQEKKKQEEQEIRDGLIAGGLGASG
jgi:hypothetical protein